MLLIAGSGWCKCGPCAPVVGSTVISKRMRYVADYSSTKKVVVKKKGSYFIHPKKAFQNKGTI